MDSFLLEQNRKILEETKNANFAEALNSILGTEVDGTVW